MIIVRLIGGLGNQMFQYALGRHLAHRNSTLLKLDVSEFEAYKLQSYGLHCFAIWQHIASIEEIETFKIKSYQRLSRWALNTKKRLGFYRYTTFDFYRDIKYLQEKSFSFDPSVLDVQGNIYLDGYWQTEKYFSEIRGILLREFACIYQQDAKSKDIAEHIQKKESVSLHIRRGDYVHDPLTSQMHGVCSLEYYREAVDRIARKIPKAHLFIFSDDHAWVRENMKFDHPFTIVDHNDASANYEDLRLMSMCRHNIIANSSFSWWGAWLNAHPDKMVIAPERWNNDPALDAQDVLPESWVKIEV